MVVQGEGDGSLDDLWASPDRVVCSYPGSSIFQIAHLIHLTRQHASFKCKYWKGNFKPEIINAQGWALMNEENSGKVVCVYYCQIKQHLMWWPVACFYSFLFLCSLHLWQINVIFLALTLCKRSKKRGFYGLGLNEAQHIPSKKPVKLSLMLCRK